MIAVCDFVLGISRQVLLVLSRCLPPHAARAYEIFRKLGMRHMCVVDNSGMLAGLLTRKNLMTFTLDDNVRELKARAVLRGWVVRHRLLEHRDPLYGTPMTEPAHRRRAASITAARMETQSSKGATP